MNRSLESVRVILIKNFIGLLTLKSYRTETPVLQLGHIYQLCVGSRANGNHLDPLLCS